MYSKNMLLSFVTASMALTQVLAVSPDNINGQQFITGECNGDLACSVGCCAFKTGLCANSIVGQESEDGGCGFGNAQPNSLSAQAFKAGKQEKEIFNFVKQGVVSGKIGPGKLDVSSLTGGGGATGGGNSTAGAGGNAGAAAGGQQAAGQKAKGQKAKGQQAAGSGSGSSASSTSAFTNADAAGNGNGEQFITGKCLSDADCDSGCCAFNTGLCAGAVFAQEAASGDGGCGFGDKKPNDKAAQALSGKRKMRRGVRAKRSE